MKRLVLAFFAGVGATLGGILLLVIGLLFGGRRVMRRAAPMARGRFYAMCERMMSEMPEDFPPRRMMTDLQAIRVQNERILRLLEGNQAAATETREPE